MVKGSMDDQGDDHCMQFLVFSILDLFNQLVDGFVSGAALTKTEQVVMKEVFLFERVVESSENDLFKHFAYGWKQCYQSVALSFICFFTVPVEKDDNSLFQWFWEAV
ncbi:hypothetical protein AVEN_103631-1 [Araneus ventricosus]|uniref:Uncharacterized protein n=1 Tax=Araneus ventricosus TaxID=182803 RepID=A0A4Y2HBG8_ARAVE|nr:hypothetical protein AVEN_103631-1 [Araneus ventricosus]